MEIVCLISLTKVVFPVEIPPVKPINRVFFSFQPKKTIKKQGKTVTTGFRPEKKVLLKIY